MVPPHSIDDALAAPARAALTGNPAAIRAFLTAIAPLVLRIARQILGRDHGDVEDVMQEALLGTLEGLGRFRGDCSVAHFVRRVAVLTALNARRRFRLRERIAPSAPLSEAESHASADGSPSDELEATRRRAKFMTLLDELPAAQAEAMALHCVLGFTIEETADAAGVALNTVRSRLSSAKAALRERIEQDDRLSQLMRGAS